MNPATNLAFQLIDEFVLKYGVNNSIYDHNECMEVKHTKTGGEYWWLGTVPYVDKEPVYDYDGLFCLRYGDKVKGVMRIKSDIPNREEYDIDFCWAGLAQCYLPIVTSTPLVVYQSQTNNKIWFRPRDEFLAKFTRKVDQV